MRYLGGCPAAEFFPKSALPFAGADTMVARRSISGELAASLKDYLIRVFDLSRTGVRVATADSECGLNPRTICLNAGLSVKQNPSVAKPFLTLISKEEKRWHPY